MSPDPAQPAPRALVVCRRYWGIGLRAVKKLGTARGGEHIDGAHWAFAGGQIKSLLSLLSYLGTGEIRSTYLGVQIPPTNLKCDDLEQTRTFAGTLADRVAAEQPHDPPAALPNTRASQPQALRVSSPRRDHAAIRNRAR